MLSKFQSFVSGLVNWGSSLFGKKPEDTPAHNDSETPCDAQEAADAMVQNAVKIALGFVRRGIPREDWEENLRGIEQLLIDHQELDPGIAKDIVDFARELLHKYGHQPEALEELLVS